MMKRNSAKSKTATATQLRLCAEPTPVPAAPMHANEDALYGALREALPLLDAAIGKLVRLIGSFTVECDSPRHQQALREFLRTVPCGYGQRGIDAFLSAYADSLLTYGRAVGEMVVSEGRLVAVCWGDVRQVVPMLGENSLELTLCVPDAAGKPQPLPCPQLLLLSTLHPEAAHPFGVSLLRGMPHLAGILLRIYETIGTNWERAGKLRYAVVCKPDADGFSRAASERAQEIANEWSEAMNEAKSGAVRDFVAVGDVSVKVIGADGPILDSEVPVRQILEQLVAKTGLPPFLLGLNWSSTERMSKQQADLLTSELWAYRRALQPALERICELWLQLNGCGGTARIVWDEIGLQDLVEEAHAALYRAQTAQILAEQ